METKSGKKSSETGERYLPEKAIKALSPQEYAATTKAKRAGKAKGKQFVAQPKSIKQKVKPFRKNINMAQLTTGQTSFNLDLNNLVEDAFERCGQELRTGYDLSLIHI